MWCFSSFSVQNGTSPLGIAKRLGYISVIDVLKLVTEESVSAVGNTSCMVHMVTQVRKEVPWHTMTQLFNQIVVFWSDSAPLSACKNNSAFPIYSPLFPSHFTPSSALPSLSLFCHTDHYREAPDEFPWDSRWDFGCFRGWRWAIRLHYYVMLSTVRFW